MRSSFAPHPARHAFAALALAALAALFAPLPATAQAEAPELPPQLRVEVNGRSAVPLPQLEHRAGLWNGSVLLRFDGDAPDPATLAAEIVTPAGLALEVTPQRDGEALVVPWFGAMTPGELAGTWRVRLGDERGGGGGFALALAPLEERALLAFAPAPSLATGGFSALTVALADGDDGPLLLARSMAGMSHSSDDEVLELRPGDPPAPLRFAMVGSWTLAATLPGGEAATATLDVLEE